MRKNRKERGLERSTGIDPHNPKIDLGKEPINLKPKAERPRIRDTTHGYSNAYGLVSMILMIALIATIVIAAPQRGNKEQFNFFSPSKFLESIATTTLTIPAGYYYCGYELKGGMGIYQKLYATIVNYKGKTFLSDNYYSYPGPYGPGLGNFTFTIDGVQYETEWVRMADAGFDDPWDRIGFKPRLNFTEPVTIDLMEYPDFTKVTKAWEEADLLTWPNAIATTGKFLTEFMTYQKNLFTAVLPWNTVASSEDVTEMQIPWRDEQNNYIEP